MAAVSIRNLDERVRDRLRVRAAQHGRSLEAEIRAILAAAVDDLDHVHAPGLAQALLTRFDDLGGVELELPSRATAPRAADLPS